jgi:hypothetical protein
MGRTTAEQGVPLKVTDPVAIEYIAHIINSARRKRLQA